MPDLGQPPDEGPAEYVYIGTIRCRACWQRGHDRRLLLLVPAGARPGDQVPATCLHCVVAPDAPLLAEDVGIFDLVDVRRVSVDQEGLGGQGAGGAGPRSGAQRP